MADPMPTPTQLPTPTTAKNDAGTISSGSISPLLSDVKQGHQLGAATRIIRSDAAKRAADQASIQVCNSIRTVTTFQFPAMCRPFCFRHSNLSVTARLGA